MLLPVLEALWRLQALWALKYVIEALLKFQLHFNSKTVPKMLEALFLYWSRLDTKQTSLYIKIRERNNQFE